MNAIIGMKNAGFTIIDAKRTDGDYGYAIGRNDLEYVTWMYHSKDDRTASFYHGHYFPIDIDSPFKSAAKALADYHSRIADAFDTLAKYGC